MAKRKPLYKKILARGFDDAPAVFTVHPAGVYGIRSWVKGFVDNPVNLGIYYYPIEKR
jgi:peptide/nickel transport system substrate-binding protein